MYQTARTMKTKKLLLMVRLLGVKRFKECATSFYRNSQAQPTTQSMDFD